MKPEAVTASTGRRDPRNRATPTGNTSHPLEAEMGQNSTAGRGEGRGASRAQEAEAEDESQGTGRRLRGKDLDSRRFNPRNPGRSGEFLTPYCRVQPRLI